MPRTCNILTTAAAIAVCILAATSCCHRHYPTQVVVRDSIVLRDRIVRDTVRLEVPKVVERIVTRDTASHLSNDWAQSDAIVSEGLLHHSLETRPRIILLPVEVPVHDTLIVQKQAEIRTETVEVEKSLSWWQRFRIGAFWWLLAASAIGWRREILSAVKMILRVI